MGSILGGKQKSSSTSSSGYSALPSSLMNAFNQLGLGIEQYTDPSNAGVQNRFTPLAQTGDETRALEMIRQGFAPNQQSIQSDIAMQMNPFDQYVIDEINRQAQGQNSVLQQNLNTAGQFGSNRGMLGANDIDLSRLNQIGGFKQSQYNTSLNNALNVLPQARAADAQGLLGIGNFQRDLDYRTKQAPIAALQAGTGMLGPFVSGGQSNQTQTGSSGFLGGLGQLAGGAGTAYLAFSDINLKEKITPKGEENGHKIYEFSYKGYPKRYIGVMAQEVRKTHPHAVINTPDGLMVNYSAIGVNFREVANG